MTTQDQSTSTAVRWNLRLYVAGQTARSLQAVRNLRVLCEEHMRDEYRIEVIDLLERPELARQHEIVAIPTLVRQLPEPIRKVIGDLSDSARVLVSLEVRPGHRP